MTETPAVIEAAPDETECEVTVRYGGKLYRARGMPVEVTLDYGAVDPRWMVMGGPGKPRGMRFVLVLTDADVTSEDVPAIAAHRSTSR